MYISVIIPIYNAEKTILKLLESISRQDQKALFEVILVDNGSSDRTVDIIKDYISQDNNTSFQLYHYKNKQSSYAARNFGVKNSNGSILAFTDADCILSDNYIVNLLNYFHHSDYKKTIVAGKIDLLVEDNENIWEIFDKECFLQNHLSKEINRVATANMVVCKELFYDVGLFLEIASSGDSEWSARGFAKGYKIEYRPEIIVFHPTRKTYAEIKRKFCRLGYGNGQRWKNGFMLLLILYFLRIFNYRTNLAISRKLSKKSGIIKVLKFNIYFHLLRFLQLIYAAKGYKSKSS